MDDPFAYGCADLRPSRQYTGTPVTSELEASARSLPLDDRRLLQPGAAEHADTVSVRPAAASSGARHSTTSASPTPVGPTRQASEGDSVGFQAPNGEATGYRDPRAPAVTWLLLVEQPPIGPAFK